MRLLSAPLLFIFLLFSVCPAIAQEEEESVRRWDLGFTAGVPFFWGDFTSFSQGKTYVGTMMGLQVVRHITPVLGVSLSAQQGNNKIGSQKHSADFLLGKDGTTYYYDPPAGVETAPYKDLYTKVRFVNFGLHFHVNVSNLIFPLNESRWSFIASPAIQTQQFSPTVYDKKTNRQFTDGSIDSDWSTGLGFDAVVRYDLSPNIDLQFRSGVTWITNNHFDGIDTPLTSKDNMSWNTMVGVVWKIR